MKRMLLSVKEIALEMGVSTQSIRRAYWKGDIPAFRVCNVLRFDLERVRQVFLARGVSTRSATDRAPGGASRPRAERHRPRLVKRGRSSQERR